MTSSEILAMKPGRELDELVAEKVMAWNMVYETHENGRDSDYSWSYAVDNNCKYRLIKPSKFMDGNKYFSPSTDISAAWEVMTYFEYNYLWRWDSAPCSLIPNGMKWECKLTSKEGIFGFGVTAQEAICKAALLAVLEGK